MPLRRGLRLDSIHYFFTIKTGQWAYRSVRSATLPSMKRWKPDLPWLPMTIIAARDESEALLVDRLTALYRRELESIETTLGRIRTGTFGACRACHQPIELARLDRFPQAEFCAGCKEMREVFERAS